MKRGYYYAEQEDDLILEISFQLLVNFPTTQTSKVKLTESFPIHIFDQELNGGTSYEMSDSAKLPRLRSAARGVFKLK